MVGGPRGPHDRANGASRPTRPRRQPGAGTAPGRGVSGASHRGSRPAAQEAFDAGLRAPYAAHTGV